MCASHALGSVERQGVSIRCNLIVCSTACSGQQKKASTQIARFMWPTWGPPRSCRPQVGPTLAPWTLLPGKAPNYWSCVRAIHRWPNRWITVTDGFPSQRVSDVITYSWKCFCPIINILRPRQNGRHIADDIFKCIYFNENVWIWFEISLMFTPKYPINNVPALVQIKVWLQWVRQFTLVHDFRKHENMYIRFLMVYQGQILQTCINLNSRMKK